MTNIPDLMTSGEVAKVLRIHRHTLRRAVRAGRVPPPVMLGERTARWHADQIAALRPQTTTEGESCE